MSVAALVLLSCSGPTVSSSPSDGGPPTETPSGEWRAGDPIPGWDEFDCSYLQVAVDLATGEQQICYASAYFSYETNDNRISLGLSASPGSWGCPEVLQGEFRGGVVVGGMAAAAPDDRWLGPYAAEDQDLNVRWLEGADMYGPAGVRVSSGEPAADRIHAAFEACVLSFAPDRLAIALRASMTAADAVTAGWAPVDDQTFRVALTLAGRFSPGDARVVCRVDGDHCPASTEANGSMVYDHELSYDDAWPWDAITDDAVRIALHDGFVPCNAEADSDGNCREW
jgi:hypothetical protein